MMAGTGHFPCASPDERGRPTRQEVESFISDLNRSVPKLELSPSDVARIFHGLLPAVRQGSHDLADREVLLDHALHGGPTGLLSVSGVKFTTSRRVAEKALRKLFPGSVSSLPFSHRTLDEALRVSLDRSVFSLNGDRTSQEDGTILDAVRDIVQSESVVHMHDLVFRRTNLWENPERACETVDQLGRILQLDRKHMASEIRLVQGMFARNL
jgi:glycerol-3-phosphate dehydrogenase